MMRKILLLGMIFIFSLIMLGCGSSDKMADKLNGTWENEILTATFDTKKGIYEGIALGKPFTNKMTIIKETPEYILFELSSEKNPTPAKFTAQFQPDGGMIFTKQEEGIPILLTRKK